MAFQRANDLEQLGVDIELFPMPRPDAEEATFDVKKFYANIIVLDADDQFQAMLGIEGANSRIFQMMKRIRQKEFRKRTQGKCMFNLSPDSQIALSFFNTIMPAKKPMNAKVNGENNKQLRSTQRFICEETGQVLYRQ
jgi:hypothetical protein